MGKSEHFLTEQQLLFFRKKLFALREEVLEVKRRKLEALKVESAQVESDDESAARATNWITECGLLNQEKKILTEIDEALERIENNTYGYCEETGKPIGIKRLEAYPTAKLSIEAQKQRENEERLMWLSER